MHTKISQMRYVRKAMGIFRCNDNGVGGKKKNSSIFWKSYILILFGSSFTYQGAYLSIDHKFSMQQINNENYAKFIHSFISSYILYINIIH